MLLSVFEVRLVDQFSFQGQTGAERVKARLEQLDSLGEGTAGVGSLREMGGLTQEQFSQHLLSLKEEMKESWRSEQRVKALKISIQVSEKLSQDFWFSNIYHTYPLKSSIIKIL